MSPVLLPSAAFAAGEGTFDGGASTRNVRPCGRVGVRPPGRARLAFCIAVAPVLLLAGCAAGGEPADAAGADRADSADAPPESSLDARAEARETASDTSDADAVEYCDGAPVRCGEVCCTGLDHHEYCSRGSGAIVPCGTKMYGSGMLRVDAENVWALPPFDGWRFRADGSEVILFADWFSPWWEIGCANWCWPDGVVLYVIDLFTEEVLHVERWTHGVQQLYEGILGGAGQLPCPADSYGSSPCCAVDVPERDVSFVFYDPFVFRPNTFETQWREMPNLRCAVRVMDPMRRETLSYIDLIVPE